MSLPYTADDSSEAHGGDPYACALYRMLPKYMQETTRQSIYLLEYLHTVPINKVGIPEYYPKLSPKLRDQKNLNLIYPVEGGIYIHVMDDPEGGRGFYISVEPRLSEGLSEEGLIQRVESEMLEYAMEFEGADTPEAQRDILVRILDKITTTQTADESGLRGFVKKLIANSSERGLTMSARDLRVLKYIMVRDKLGMGILEPMIRDSNIEDVSCSGLGPMFIEHKVFKSLRTAYEFTTDEELNRFVLRLSERIKKPVTYRNPIVDAILPDGSRINIVYGGEISQRGSNFTIRKFSDVPFSIIELIQFGTLDFMMAAYLSIVMEDGMNVFIAGETASGKTTLLNAMTAFIPHDAKIVSIEDTPEVQVPHPNWIRESTRASKPGEDEASVSMFDLLKAALRQRPNEIIVGEIRGEEGHIAFQAMQTGHSCMSTFHASSVQKLIQRLTGNPINVPKTYIDNLNIAVVQSTVRLPDGHLARRAVSVAEIIGYEASTDTFSFTEVFRWNPTSDTFEFTGEMNSYILESKIAPRRGIPEQKKRQIYALVRRRARILEKLAQSGVTEYYEFYKILTKAQKEGIF